MLGAGTADHQRAVPELQPCHEAVVRALHAGLLMQAERLRQELQGGLFVVVSQSGLTPRSGLCTGRLGGCCFAGRVREGDIRNCFGKLNDPGKPALRRLCILPQQLRRSPLFALEMEAHAGGC